jgi:endonuclease/exonuclease/phosphatase family metal-dependent hydrolase
MRILTWNVNRRWRGCLEGIRGLKPDIVMLQEVTHENKRGIMATLELIGCKHSRYSGDVTDPRKRYGNVTASRWPVSAVSRGWAPKMPWPQLGLRATVHTPHGDVDTINVHIPDGSNNGWRKIDSIEAVADAVESGDNVARVLAGDFREPQMILPGGRLVTFGQRIYPDGSIRLGRRRRGGAPPGSFMDREGRTYGLHHWDATVRRIFEGSSRHGLRHVIKVDDEWPSHVPTTHYARNTPRFFDHIFVSRHFRVTGFRYVDDVREESRYSDHSAVYADVEVVEVSG